jgi:hypothetical protein
MLLKITLTTATTLRSVGDTSIADMNLQVVTIGQLCEVIN